MVAQKVVKSDTVSLIIIRRQQSLWLIVGGLIGFMILGLLRWYFQRIPLPSSMGYLPLLPAFLIFLGSWIYPTAGLSSSLREGRFQIRLSSLMLLLWTPFWGWMQASPHHLFFLINVVVLLGVGVWFLFELSRFILLHYPLKSTYRMLANYTKIMLFYFLLLPIIILILSILIMNSIWVSDVLSIFSYYPFWAWCIQTHEIIILLWLCIICPVHYTIFDSDNMELE